MKMLQDLFFWDSNILKTKADFVIDAILSKQNIVKKIYNTIIQLYTYKKSTQ